MEIKFKKNSRSKLYGLFLMLLVILVSTVRTYATQAQVSDELVITNHNLRLVFDRFKGYGLSSIKFDTVMKGNWQEIPEMLSRLWLLTYEVLENPKGSELPRIFFSEQVKNGTIVGVSDLFKGGLRYYVTYFIPDDMGNTLYVRFRVSALDNSEYAQIFWYRFDTTRFFHTGYLLPKRDKAYIGAEVTKDPRYITLEGKYPEDAEGYELQGENNIKIIYLMLPSDATKWSLKLPDPKVYGEGSWFTPEFHLPGTFLPEGFSKYQDFCLGFTDNPDTANLITSIKSHQANFIAYLDEAEKKLHKLEFSWKKDTVDKNFRQDITKIQEELVIIQCRYHDLKNLYEDIIIKDTLASDEKEKVTVEKELRYYKSNYERLLENFRKISNSLRQLGFNYASAGNSSITDFSNALAEYRKQQNLFDKDLLKKLKDLRSSNKGIAFSEEVKRPFDPSKWFFGITAFVSRGDTGPGNLDEELRKMKIFGMDGIELSIGDFSQVWSLVNGDNNAAAKLKRDLDACRKIGLKVFLFFSYDCFLPIQIEGKIPDYDSGFRMFGSNPTPDYLNPAVAAVGKETFRKFGKFLKDNYSDIVVGITYNNERTFYYPEKSKYLKPAFLTYLKTKYADIENLNKIWDESYVSWADIEEKLNIDGLKANREIPIAESGKRQGKISDWLIFTVESYAEGFWGIIYNSLKESWPELIIIPRHPWHYQETVHRLSADISSLHWTLPTEYGPMLRSQGKPYINSEFWWSILYSYGWLKQQLKEDVSWYAPFVKTSNEIAFPTEQGDRACWLHASQQLWRNFLWDCKGYSFYMWGTVWHNEASGILGNLMEWDTGILRESTADVHSTLGEMRRVEELLRNTRIWAETAVLVSETDSLLNGQSVVENEACSMMSNANVPYEVITDNSILTGKLKKYRVLWIPCKYSLPTAVADKIISWSKAGGTLVLVGPCGITDETGTRSDLFKDISGVRYVGIHEAARGFLIPSAGIEISVGPKFMGTLQWGKERRFYRLDIGDNNDYNILGKFSDDSPAIIEKKAGLGRVITCGIPFQAQIWSAYHYDKKYLDGYKKAIDWLIDLAGVRRIVRINNPEIWGTLKDDLENVTVIIRKNEIEDCFYIFLVNSGHNAFDRTEFELARVREGNPVSIKLIFDKDLNIQKINEIMRGVSLKLFKSAEGITTQEIMLYPGKIYILKAEL